MKNDEKYALNGEYTERHKIKENDQLRWVQMMNNVRISVEETIMRELILA